MIKPPVTAEALLEMAAMLGPCELVRGELREMTPAGFEHGAITMRISRMVGEYVDARRLGVVLAAETGFTLQRNPDTVRAPDVAFVSKARVPARDDRRGFAELAPDLVVEVLSPGNAESAMREKIDDYLQAGVRLLWIVDPRNRTVDMYHGSSRRTIPVDGTVGGEDVLPGFSCAVSAFFAFG